MAINGSYYTDIFTLLKFTTNTIWIFSPSALKKERASLLQVKNNMAADLERLLSHREVTAASAATLGNLPWEWCVASCVEAAATNSVRVSDPGQIKGLFSSGSTGHSVSSK